ncbi:12924_t:CDS:2 [Funneliformis geosporum]|uniref:12924_t:CDS:1 n=1 Tax=Funneliformis geosporum TaxID=1117311 RepID=A0A9W4T125_9GLOM|nr:12924_t:CDS:2 [Funneliformis geosporum]
MNYYENTIADNIHNLITYPTDDKMHLVIHKAHEQASVFAKVLEFIEYKNLFYDRIFISHMLAYESDLLNVDLNQDDDGLEKINKVDCELNEISKAAELVNTYNMEKIDDLEQSQIKIRIDFIYNQSDKKFIQESSEYFKQHMIQL